MAVAKIAKNRKKIFLGVFGVLAANQICRAPGSSCLFTMLRLSLIMQRLKSTMDMGFDIMKARGRLKRVCLAAVFISSLACGPARNAGDDEPVRHAVASVGAVWSEYMTASEVERSLPDLARFGVALHLAWPAHALDDSARVSLARRAEALGVPLRPWLLLSESDGYWPGSTNARAFADAAQSLFRLYERERLRPTALIVDLELRLDRAKALGALLKRGSVDAVEVGRFLSAGINRDEFARATQTYRDLVDDAHRLGWRVDVSTLPQILDDDEDGDDSIRQALGLPIDGVGWDRVSVQVYRTLFDDLYGSFVGGKFSPALIANYGASARRRFGERAGLDLGLTAGGIAQNSVYASASELHADVAAALGAGFSRNQLNLYSLDGLAGRADIDSWIGSPSTDSASTPPSRFPASSPSSDAAADAVRMLFGALDALAQ